MTVEAVVRRKTQDLVRDSAEALLRESVEGVVGVERAELWSFEVDGPDGEERVHRILDRTTLVVNPNVHRYAIGPWDAPPARGARLLVRVKDRVDPKGRSVLRAVRERLGLTDVRGAERSVLWTVDLESAAPDLVRSASETVLGSERGAGVLVNRHAQDAELTVVEGGS